MGCLRSVPGPPHAMPSAPLPLSAPAHTVCLALRLPLPGLERLGRRAVSQHLARPAVHIDIGWGRSGRMTPSGNGHDGRPDRALFYGTGRNGPVDQHWRNHVTEPRIALAASVARPFRPQLLAITLALQGLPRRRRLRGTEVPKPSVIPSNCPCTLAMAASRCPVSGAWIPSISDRHDS